MYVEPMSLHAGHFADLLWTVECLRRVITAMARPEYGHPLRILFHPHQCHISRDLDARFGRTGRQKSFHSVSLFEILWINVAEMALGSIMAVL